MIYEIGWSSYDMRYIIPVLCFIPLLILFVLLQKRYNTKDEGEKIPYEHEKSGVVNVVGSKSTTKFMISALLVVLMIASLFPMLTLVEKHRNIISYKNGEYEVFTGIARRYLYNVGFKEKSQNEGEYLSFFIHNAGAVTEVVKNDIKDGEEYTIYYTYSISEKTGEHIPRDILRIDKVQ